MEDFSQVASQITQFRNFFVNEAVSTVQQVQAGTQQIQRQQPPAASVVRTGQGNNLFWFGLGTIAALVVAYYYWKR